MGAIIIKTNSVMDEYLLHQLGMLCSQGVLRIKDGRHGVVLHIINEKMNEGVENHE